MNLHEDNPKETQEYYPNTFNKYIKCIDTFIRRNKMLDATSEVGGG